MKIATLGVARAWIWTRLQIFASGQQTKVHNKMQLSLGTIVTKVTREKVME